VPAEISDAPQKSKPKRVQGNAVEEALKAIGNSRPPWEYSELKDRKRELQVDIAKAEAKNDTETVNKLKNELNELQTRMNRFLGL
jgi:predicted RNase H-like nuclease (RuvC/YqgF family)